MKIVIGAQTGKTYQIELDEEKSQNLDGHKIGEEISGDLFNLDGYTLLITGGSDKQGFAMRKGIHNAERNKVLLVSGTGLRKPSKGVRRRKTVHGEIVGDDIAQLNLKVLKTGKDNIEKVLGKKEEALVEGETSKDTSAEKKSE